MTCGGGGGCGKKRNEGEGERTHYIGHGRDGVAPCEVDGECDDGCGCVQQPRLDEDKRDVFERRPAVPCRVLCTRFVDAPDAEDDETCHKVVSAQQDR